MWPEPHKKQPNELELQKNEPSQIALHKFEPMKNEPYYKYRVFLNHGELREFFSCIGLQ